MPSAILRTVFDRLRRVHPLGVLAVAAMLALTFWLGGIDARVADRSRILDAIRQVESGGMEDPPDGDGGRAIGPYQIHRIYWKDAIAFEPELGGDYQDCRDRAYAERIVDAYMRRWVPDAWENADAETVARTHNGGPRGAEKQSTLKYWGRVRGELESR